MLIFLKIIDFWHSKFLLLCIFYNFLNFLIGFWIFPENLEPINKNILRVKLNFYCIIFFFWYLNMYNTLILFNRRIRWSKSYFSFEQIDLNFVFFIFFCITITENTAFYFRITPHPCIFTHKSDISFGLQSLNNHYKNI